MRITGNQDRTGQPVVFRHTGMVARIQRESWWMKEFLNTEIHTQVLPMNHLWSPREVRIWVSTVFILTFLKTEIARSARGPKSQGPRAEDVLAESYFVQKFFCDLMTADHKVLSEGCESRNNHQCAVVVQDLDTQWIQSYPCKTKTSQDSERSLQKFMDPIGSLKSFTLTIPWNLARLVKIFLGIVRQHHTDRKQMGLLKEQCAESKKVPLRYCCNRVWMKVGGQILWNVTPICEMLQISYLMGKPYERRFGQPFKGPIVPFGSLVEYYLISAKDLSRIHQIGKKVLPRFVPWIRSVRRGEFGRVT